MDELRRSRVLGRLLAAWLLLWFVAMGAMPIPPMASLGTDAWSAPRSQAARATRTLRARRARKQRRQSCAPGHDAQSCDDPIDQDPHAAMHRGPSRTARCACTRQHPRLRKPGQAAPPAHPPIAPLRTIEPTCASAPTRHRPRADRQFSPDPLVPICRHLAAQRPIASGESPCVISTGLRLSWPGPIHFIERCLSSRFWPPSQALPKQAAAPLFAPSTPTGARVPPA